MPSPESDRAPTAHTQLPWRQHTQRPHAIVTDPFGVTLALCIKPEDAALVVRAVNNHDPLLSALERLVALPGISSLAADLSSDAVVRAAKVCREAKGE